MTAVTVDHVLGEAGQVLLTAAKFALAALTVLVIVRSFTSLLRQRLFFQQFSAGDDAGAGQGPAGTLRALIRVEIEQLVKAVRTAAGEPLRIDQAGPYEDSYDLGALANGMPPVFKQLIAAISAFRKQLGSKSKVVTARLLPSARVVLGIETVQGGLERTVLIRRADLHLPDPHKDALEQLAGPAAAWIIFAAYPGVTLSGTADWRSYVYFAAANAWQRLGELDRAKDLYTRARDEAVNTAADLNLAALEQIDEHRADVASLPADPQQRQSARRLARVIEIISPSPLMHGGSPALQWYRASYLLSVDLRDVADANAGLSEEISAEVQDALKEARRSAIGLAQQIEENLGDLPPRFVRYGRAAALTLAARQALRPVPAYAEAIVVSNSRRGIVSLAELRTALTRLRAGDTGPGIAERIVAYVADSKLPIDDQAKYNLMRYHETRQQILETAISYWQLRRREVRENAQLQSLEGTAEFADWDYDAWRWLDVLREQMVIERRLTASYRHAVLAAGNPLLVVRIPAERETAESSRLHYAQDLPSDPLHARRERSQTQRPTRPPARNPDFLNPEPPPKRGQADSSDGQGGAGRIARPGPPRLASRPPRPSRDRQPWRAILEILRRLRLRRGDPPRP